jgi:uncharacterized protein UU153
MANNIKREILGSLNDETKKVIAKLQQTNNLIKQLTDEKKVLEQYLKDNVNNHEIIDLDSNLKIKIYDLTTKDSIVLNYEKIIADYQVDTKKYEMIKKGITSTKIT